MQSISLGKMGKRASTPGRRKRGFTLMEVLVAVTLSFLVAAGAWSLISIHSRGSLEAVATSDRLDATRIVRGILESELEVGLEGRDWVLFPGDSLAVRGFRGVAVPCGPAASGSVEVLVRSVRRPDPGRIRSCSSFRRAAGGPWTWSRRPSRVWEPAVDRLPPRPDSVRLPVPVKPSRNGRSPASPESSWWPGSSSGGATTWSTMHFAIESAPGADNL